MNIRDIRDLVKGFGPYQKESVTFNAYIVSKDLKNHKKSRGDDDPRRYCFMDVQDSSAEVRVSFFDYDANKKEHQTLAPGRFVRISGDAGLYEGSPSVTIKSFSLLSKENPEDYIRFAKIDIRDEEERLHKLAKGMKDKDAAKLMTYYLNDEAFMKFYWRYPAAKKMHDILPRGLAKHSGKVIHIARGIAALYPSANIDWITVGAFLHDMGKFMEFEIDKVGRCTDYSIEGALLGHQEIANRELVKVCRSLNISEKKTTYLRHMILAHHGRGEWGAAKTPQTIDAMILHLADYIDSKCEPMEAVSQEIELGEKSMEKVQAIDGSYVNIYLPDYRD